MRGVRQEVYSCNIYLLCPLAVGGIRIQWYQETPTRSSFYKKVNG